MRADWARGAPEAMVRDGVSFVSFAPLVEQIGAAKPKVGAVSRWDAATRTATLQSGSLRLSFTPGKRAMTVRQNDAPTREVPLRAAPVMLSIGKQSRLYVPLAAPVRALGLSLQVEPDKHFFNIGR